MTYYWQKKFGITLRLWLNIRKMLYYISSYHFTIHRNYLSYILKYLIYFHSNSYIYIFLVVRLCVPIHAHMGCSANRFSFLFVVYRLQWFRSEVLTDADTMGYSKDKTNYSTRITTSMSSENLLNYKKNISKTLRWKKERENGETDGWIKGHSTL